MLESNEKYIADGGYADGGQWSETPNGMNNEFEHMKSTVRSRHETVNARFKRWGILQGRFRHEVWKHGMIFSTIANITQLQIMYDEPLFHIDYNEDKQQNYN